eukprot:jgi/Botrbrau1/7612/Bobra.0159s0061.1
MGGDHPHGEPPYKGIWSPAGGWYPDPKHWRRNTLITVAGMVLVLIPIWNTSTRLEKRYGEPTRWIPSMLWNKNILPVKE